MEGLWRAADTISIRCFKNNLPSLAKKSARYGCGGFLEFIKGFYCGSYPIWSLI